MSQLPMWSVAGMGANVIILGRDAGRVEKALAAVKARSGVSAASYLCDFFSLRAVRYEAAQPSSLAQESDVARRLWQESERLSAHVVYP